MLAEILQRFWGEGQRGRIARHYRRSGHKANRALNLVLLLMPCADTKIWRMHGSSNVSRHVRPDPLRPHRHRLSGPRACSTRSSWPSTTARSRRLMFEPDERMALVKRGLPGQPQDQGHGLQRPDDRLCPQDERAGDRAGAARLLGLRVRVPHGPGEPAPGNRYRDRGADHRRSSIPSCRPARCARLPPWEGMFRAWCRRMWTKPYGQK